MTPAGLRSGEGAAPRGRPFFRAGRAAALAAALALSQPAAAASLIAADAAGASLIPTGAAGAPHIDLLECDSGRPAGHATLDAPLAAPPVLAADGSALYAVTVSSELLRLTVPALAPAARATLAHRPAALAAGSGPDAILLAGGRGDEPLSAHDPVTLAELARYRHRDGKTATVSAVLDNPGRSALLVGFGDLPEAWEIVYDRAAPPVLLGFVHDYRNNEAVPLPGRLTARPFVVASPTRAFAPGPVPWELARIDDRGAFGVLNLEVRREIERPAVPPPGAPERVAAWRFAATDPGSDGARTGARGWVAASPGSSSLVPMRAVGWRPLSPIEFKGEVLALAPEPWGSRVLVAHRGQAGIIVSAVDPAGGAIAQLSVLPMTGGQDAAPVDRALDAGLRFVLGSGARCVALLDAAGRWLGSVTAPEAGSPPPTLKR